MPFEAKKDMHESKNGNTNENCVYGKKKVQIIFRRKNGSFGAVVSDFPHKLAMRK